MLIERRAFQMMAGSEKQVTWCYCDPRPCYDQLCVFKNETRFCLETLVKAHKLCIVRVSRKK